MGINYKYDAFISYRHVSPDKEIAEKLQKKLENYTPPKALRSDKKQGRWHIFRDETELPTSSDLSNDIKSNMRMITYNQNLSNYCVDNNLYAFLKRNLKNNTERIAYFKNGDEKFSYINDGSHALEFKQGTVSSIVCNGSEGVIAFINKEGYIGIYKYGADAISKIPLNQSEVTPVKILLTADAEHIIVMCSNGNLEKYSTKISKKVGECDTELALNADSQFDFIDKDTLIARKFKFSSDVIIVNVNTMGVQTKVNQFIHFMKQDKKIIAYTYIDSKKTLGYYNYLSKDELVEFASNFLKKFDA